MRTHCRNGHEYPKDLKSDYRGHRRCPICLAASRKNNAENHRRIRRQFTGTANIEPIGDTPAQKQAREAAAYWAYGDNSELRYG